MPGYEPFLLCDFHVHTRWSDGQLTVKEVVDLYGSTGKFDVIAITDHILMKRDIFARAGWSTCGKRPIVTICFRSPASNVIRTWRTATSTSRSTSTRGRR